jgi:antitoxin (DNA-binding transcriptional repressor) of toxin-antitoxin stability system
MRRISISKFKAECLALLDSLDSEGLIVTKHGKVLAKVIPVEQESASLIGCLKGKISKKGDILSTGIKWNAES